MSHALGAAHVIHSMYASDSTLINFTLAVVDSA